MRYSDMKPGMYIVRTRELPWAKVLSGEICYVDKLSGSDLVIRLTEDCAPKKDAFALGMEGDDGNWHDVSDLVFDANRAITPPSNLCAFTAPSVVNYRNFLGLNDIPALEGTAAIDRLCLRGEQGKTGMVYDKVGYFVVGYEDGYYIGYSGYCTYLPADQDRKLQLQILRMPAGRKLYPAETIVSACAKAYGEDLGIADSRTDEIISEVHITGDVLSQHYAGSVKELHLV